MVSSIGVVFLRLVNDCQNKSMLMVTLFSYFQYSMILGGRMNIGIKTMANVVQIWLFSYEIIAH